MDINDYVSEVERKARFHLIDDLVSKPSTDELKDAIYDAMDDINSTEPETAYKVQEVLDMTDTRLKRLLTIGASRNAIQTLIYDWTANGLDADLGNGISVANRLGDFQSLHQQLTDEFNDRLEKFKASALKTSSVTHFRTSKNLLAPFGNSFGKRATRYSKSVRY